MPYMRYSRKVSRKVRHPRCLLLLLVNWGECFCDHLKGWGVVSGLTPPLHMVDPQHRFIAFFCLTRLGSWHLFWLLIWGYKLCSISFLFWAKCFKKMKIKQLCWIDNVYIYITDIDNRWIHNVQINYSYISLLLCIHPLILDRNIGAFSLYPFGKTQPSPARNPYCFIDSELTLGFHRFGTKLKPLILTWSYGRLGRSSVACGETSRMRKNRTI